MSFTLLNSCNTNKLVFKSDTRIIGFTDGYACNARMAKDVQHYPHGDDSTTFSDVEPIPEGEGFDLKMFFYMDTLNKTIGHGNQKLYFVKQIQLSETKSSNRRSKNPGYHKNKQKCH